MPRSESDDGAPVEPKKKMKVSACSTWEWLEFCRMSSSSRTSKKSVQHDKPKPWDHEGIDHWTVEPFRPEYNPTGLLEESSFACLFPKYREKYLRESWPAITRALKEVGRRVHDGSHHQENLGSVHHRQGERLDQAPVSQRPCCAGAGTTISSMSHGHHIYQHAPWASLGVPSRPEAEARCRL
jgi:hypothetical protein